MFKVHVRRSSCFEIVGEIGQCLAAGHALERHGQHDAVARNVDKELALGGTDKRIRLLRAADGGDNALFRRVQPIDGEVLARGCAARGHAQNEVQPRRVVKRAHRFAAVVIRDGNDVIEFHVSRPPTVR